MPTEHNDIKDSFDQLISRKVLSFEDAPPQNAWANISKQIESIPGSSQAQPFWKNMFFLTATVVIITSAIVFMFFRNDEKMTMIKPEIKHSEIKTNSSSTMETLQDNTGNQAPLEFNNTLPDKATGTVAKRTPEQLTSTSEKIPGSASTTVNKVGTVAEEPSIEKEPSTATALPHIIVPARKDSVASINSPDTLKKTVKPKSFYDKQLKDTTMKYQKLFRKN